MQNRVQKVYRVLWIVVALMVMILIVFGSCRVIFGTTTEKKEEAVKSVSQEKMIGEEQSVTTEDNGNNLGNPTPIPNAELDENGQYRDSGENFTDAAGSSQGENEIVGNGFIFITE